MASNTQLNLKQKALLLIAVPLLFEICFVTALFISLKQLEQEYKQEAAAKDVLMCVNSILNNIIDGAGAIGFFQINHDEQYMMQFHSAQENLKIRRKQLLQVANDNQRAELAVFNGVTDEVIETFDKVSALIRSNDKLDLLRMTIRMQRLLKKVNESEMKVMQEQATITDRQRLEQARLRDNAEKIVLVGIVLSIILAVFLALYFNRTTAARLDVLLRNALRLAMEKSLEPPLTGIDEIAKIDHAFHEMSLSLQQARQKEQALTQNALDVICSLDQKGRFTAMNQAVETAWGMKREDLLGRSVFSIMGDESVSATRRNMEDLIVGKSSGPVETAIRRFDGSLSASSWSMQWSPVDKSFFCVAHDISERKRIERLRQDVVSMVSHDLKAPLTAIRVTFDLFKMGSYGQVDESGLQKITKAELQIDRMVSMISDLLDIERLEAGVFELKFSEVRARTIIERSIDAVQSVAERRKIKIQMNEQEPDLLIKCDQERIVRVIVNLLHNAIKFSPPQSVITVKAESEEDFAKLSVIDQGKGIAADKLSIIFERFKQIEEGERDSSGLGLAICKAIVEAHHGRIEAISAPGQGSTFWFTIPG